MSKIFLIPLCLKGKKFTFQLFPLGYRTFQKGLSILESRQNSWLSVELTPGRFFYYCYEGDNSSGFLLVFLYIWSSEKWSTPNERREKRPSFYSRLGIPTPPPPPPERADPQWQRLLNILSLIAPASVFISKMDCSGQSVGVFKFSVSDKKIQCDKQRPEN